MLSAVITVVSSVIPVAVDQDVRYAIRNIDAARHILNSPCRPANDRIVDALTRNKVRLDPDR